MALSALFTWCMPDAVVGAGYGKGFLHAGDKEWGVGKMQHDLTDAVQWGIEQARPARCVHGAVLRFCAKRKQGGESVATQLTSAIARPHTTLDLALGHVALW